MFHSFSVKFTFFFWLTFFSIILPLYVIGTHYTKNALIEVEQEKIEILTKTLKPTIALSLSFDQPIQLKAILNSILKNDQIEQISIITTADKTVYKKVDSTIALNSKELFVYTSPILDPFTHHEIASMEVLYINKHLLNFNDYLYKIILILFLFFLGTFAIFYLVIRNDLFAIREIASSLEKYSHSKQNTPIVVKYASSELTTIANVANDMIKNMSQYLQRLKTFNDDLKKQVARKIREKQEQEKLMLHQSRQAAMGEMLESIAHQWRQPLNNIGLAAANLSMQHSLGTYNEKDFEKLIDIISTNINFMSSTIDDFRNFLDPNQKMDYFLPYKPIEETLHILDAQLENKHISYTVHFKQDDIKFYGLENELKQILLVLLNNSQDALSEKGGGHIDIYLAKHKNNVSLTVCDNGGGIDKSIIDKVFEPYFTTKFKSQGTGIGLYIVKNIIETKMKGTITVQNTKEGCCFTIVLPAQTREAEL
ncbi:sensor histidine kinase [Sulfurimonas sp.]|uniref:sensor histidine kinase n=1 Tax=Sulfurimonas sp. TaxID=2022749 RepID=UPI003D0E34D9